MLVRRLATVQAAIDGLNGGAAADDAKVVELWPPARKRSRQPAGQRQHARHRRAGRPGAQAMRQACRPPSASRTPAMRPAAEGA